MPLQALSLGFKSDTGRSCSGVVHSSFEHAVNLLIDGEMWTLLAAAQQDAPFGIRLSAGVRPGGLGLVPSDRVHVRAGFVGVGEHVIDCRAAVRWMPSRWESPAEGLSDRVTFVEQRAQLRAWAESIEMASEVTAALRGSDAELIRAARRSIGRGPGLTPAGDDVLVGILTVLTSGAGGPGAVEAASRLAFALAPLLPSTSDISRHLLAQSARGLPGRALHTLGRVVYEGASIDALPDALEAVLDTGCTSGADACLGLAAAIRLIASLR